MRPKPAGVLVERDGRVAALADMPVSVSGDARAIVEQHARLWGVAAYVHPSVTASLQRTAALAWLKDKTGLGFLTDQGGAIPSVEDLLFDTLVRATKVDESQHAEVRRLATASAKAGQDPLSIAL